MTRSSKIRDLPNPAPFQGVGEFGRPRYSRTVEIAGSNPAAPTINSITTTAAVAQQSWS